MKTKKSSVMKLLFLLMVSMFALAAVSCTNRNNQSSGTDEEFQATGIYYYDAEFEEYLISLSGKKFHLTIADDAKEGSYTYDGEKLTLKFTGSEMESEATLKDNVLTLTYNNASYRFLKRVNFVVTYNANGGSNVDKSFVVNGKTLSKPTDPVKEGYNFIAWYTDEAFTTPFAFNSQQITANTTLYARFEKSVEGQKEYQASFALDYDGAALASQKTVGGRLYNLPTPKRDGYTFIGWWMSDFNNANKLTAKYDGQELSQNVTLYSMWESDAPAISVTETGASWTAKGVNNSYKIVITAPDGTTESKTISTSTYKYDFASKDSGEYKVEVSIANTTNTSTAYYKNKTLARVSLFSVVEPSVLVFSPVDNAEKYLITVDCGNEGHQHTAIDNGKSTNFNFANCLMQKGGIKFTVQAVANGYLTSTSEVFTYERNLEEVKGLTLDKATETLSWNEVANALSYNVKITDANGEYTENVGSKTTFSLKKFSGDIKVEVTPVTSGYNSPNAAELTYNKARLATPDNLSLADKTLTWDAVEGATGYNVKIYNAELGEKVFAVETNSLVLTNEHFSYTKYNYEFSLQAVGATEAASSLYTDVQEVLYSKMGELTYENGELSWPFVIGAINYVVKVNDGKEITIKGNTNKYTVALTKAGKNTISVCALDLDEQRTTWATTEVFARTVYFDARGGTEVKSQYKVVGDLMNLPTTSLDGFAFAGWYNVPGGAKANGAEYTDVRFAESGDIVLYAYWTPKPYKALLTVDDNGILDTTEKTVYFREDFTLPTAESKDSTKTFGGWYSEPNGQGIRYTDPLGNSVAVWNDINDVTLYAAWIDVTTFTLLADGKSYSASKGAGIQYVDKVVIPQTYKGLPVTTVDSFTSCSKLVSIDIPDTIKLIQTNAAFVGCYSLESINIIPVEGNNEKLYESVDGVLFFYNANNGKELKFFPPAKGGSYRVPDGVQTLPINVFSGAKITEIFIPASVTAINNTAFSGCWKLTNVVFERAAEGVEEKELILSAQVFKGCSSLTSVTLPGRVKEINTDIFTNCSRLEEIIIDGTGNYVSKDGVLCNADGTEIIFCPVGKSGSFRIPSGVTSIADSAFSGCSKLTEVIIPGYVSNIGADAFYNCKSIEKVVFEGEEGDVGLAIGQSAFYGCYALTEVTLPANISSIAKYAFGGNNNLYKATVNCGAEATFENGIFSNIYNNNYVTELYLGANVPLTEINGVFGGPKLAKVVVDPTNPNYASIDDVLFNKDITNIVYYPSGKIGDYTIPDTIKVIGAGVFRSKSNITNITINKNITSIGELAFADSSLSNIIFEEGGTEALVIKDYAFDYCRYLTNVVLPSRLTVLGNEVFNDCSGLASITIPEGVLEIGDGAFKDCEALTEITIPASVVKMGAYADKDGVPTLKTFSVFDECMALHTINVAEGNTVFTSVDGVLYTKKEGFASELIMSPHNKSGVVDIPKTVTKIWDGAFKDNAYVTEIKFSQGLDGALDIGVEVFYGCKGLEKVTLPDGITKIGKNTFNNCKVLSEIVIPNTVITLESGAFFGCSSLSKITFNEGGTEGLVLGDGSVSFPTGGGQYETTYSGVFATLSQIKEITLPERTTSIGIAAFAQCKGLETLNLPASLTEIKDYAFYETTGLKTVTVGENSALITIGKNAFYKSSLSSINLGNNIETISDYAFQNAKLTSIVIPSSVVTIGTSAFYGNSSMLSMTFAADSQLTKIGPSSISYCSSLTEIVIPKSVTAIDANAFLNSTSLASITFEEGSNLATIGNNAFSNTAITSFNFPTSTSKLTLGTTLFANCSQLTHINLSSSVTGIEKVFVNCPTITSITVDEDNENFSNDPNLPILLNKTGTAIQYIYGTLSAGSFVIPSNVTEIGANAFENQLAVTSVYIPKSVKAIGDNAFAGCKNLTTVLFEEQSLLTSTGVKVFMNCTSLTEITLPESLQLIKDYTFQGCTSLETVNLSTTLTQIGNSSGYVFDQCASLKNITLPQTLTTLKGSYNFQNCTSLTTIAIPGSIQSWDKYMFKGCTSLSNVTLSDELTVLGDYMFQNCTALTSIVLPTNLVNIGSSTFSNTGLTSITLPATLVNLYNSTSKPSVSTGSYAFEKCANLASVTFLGDVQVIGAGAFSGCTALKQITIPDSVTMICNQAFKQSGLTSIILNGVTTVGANVFEGCESLSMVTLNDSLTALGNYMFKECSALKEITLPSSLNFMGTYTFQNSGLTKITIPEGVLKFGTSATSASTSSNVYLFDGCVDLELVNLSSKFNAMGAFIFRGCVKLTSIAFPDTLTTIGNSAFEGSGLTSAKIKNVTSLGSSVFKNCENFESVELNSTIKSLGGSLFENCLQLKNVTLPSSLTSIGGSAFKNSGITSIIIPNTVKTFNTYTFDNCKYLASVTLGSNVTSINSYTFSNCPLLTSITLPDTLTTLSGHAFANSGLESITLPKSLRYFNDGVFAGCKSLEAINLDESNEYFKVVDGLLYKIDNTLVCCPAGKTTTADGKTGVITLETGVTIAKYAFEGCENIIRIYLPSDLTVIADYAFANCYGLKNMEVPVGVTKIGNYAFQNCTNLINLDISSTVTSIGNYAFDGCTALQSVELPTDLATIGTYAFRNSGLTSIEIPASITSITTSVFESCASLANVSFLGEVTNLGANAFKNSGLTSFVFPASVTTVGNNVLSGTKLKSITIPATITKLASSMFDSCEELESVIFEEGVTTLGTSMFANCIGLKNITWCSTLTELSSKSFQNSGLETVTIPSNILALKGYVFQNSSLLKEVIFEDGLESFDAFNFDNCSSLEKVTLPETLVKMSTFNFRNCVSLKEINIPTSLATLTMQTFENCTSLKSIFIPKEVVLADSVFLGWTKEQTVYIEASQADVKNTWNAKWYNGSEAAIVYDYVKPQTLA